MQLYHRMALLTIWLMGIAFLTACQDQSGAVVSTAGSVVTSGQTLTTTLASTTTSPVNTLANLGTVSQGDHKLFVEPDDGNGPVVSAIGGAKSTVEMKMYLISEREVVDALKAAQARGVKVRVMLEEHPYGEGVGNDANFKSFQAAGIEVKWTNPVFALTHEKSLIIDHQTALIMTLNLTHSAFTANREYGIITNKPAETQEVLAGFEADWSRTALTPPTASPLLWSNLNSRAKILAFIDGARQSLLMEQEEMQDSEVQQHLVNAAGRGVKVQVIVAGNFTSTKPDSNRPGEEQLTKNGVAVELLASPYVHAKIYLADNNRVIVCSENVSTSSLNNNRELGIAVSDPAIVGRIAQSFAQDWAKGKHL